MRQQLFGRRAPQPGPGPIIDPNYSDPLASVDPASVPSIASLAPEPTPLLDLAGGYDITPDEPRYDITPDEPRYDITPDEPRYDITGPDRNPVSGYLADDAPVGFASATDNVAGGYELPTDDVGSVEDGRDPTTGYLSDGSVEADAPAPEELGYLIATAEESEALAAAPPTTHLPALASADREVAHPTGWWDKRVGSAEGVDRSGKYEANLLHSLYKDEQEDAKAFRGTGQQWSQWGEQPAQRTFTKAATQHWNQDTIDAHQVKAKDGKLRVGESDLDTRGASGVGTQLATVGNERVVSGKGKFIYTMDKDGKLVAADAWGEHQERSLEGSQVNGKDPHQLRMVNHSSLTGGEGAAGAGELQVEKGRLQQVTDSSGHYMPSGKMTANVVKELMAQGVDMHDVATRLTRNNGKEDQLHASARELLEVQAKLDASGSTEDARDVMTRRRGDFREDLKQNGASALENHIDVGEVERRGREARGEKVGRVLGS